MNATEIIQFQSIVKGVITSEDTWMVIDSVVVTSQHYRRDTNVNVDDADLARNLDRRRRMKEEQGTVPWRLHISGYILGRVVSFPMNDLGKRLFVVRLGRLLSNLDDHGNVLQGPLSESMPLFDVEPTEWYNITVADADPTVGKEPSSQGIVQDATSEDNGEASTSDSTFVRAGIGIGVAGFLVLAAVLAKSTERRRTRRWNVNAGRNANDPAADQTEQEGGIYIVEAGEMMDVSSPASLSPKRTSCSNHDTLVHTRTQSYYSQSNDHCHRNGMEENKVSTLSYSDTSSEFLEHDFFMSLTSSSVNTASATLTTKNSAEMQMQMHEDMVTGMDMNMQMDIDADGHRDGGRDGDGMGWSQNFPVQKLVRSHFASLDVSHHQHQQHDSQLENDMDALAYLEEDASLSTECHDGNDVASNVNSLMNDTPNKNVDHQGGMRRMFACFGDGRTSTHGNGTIPRSGSKVPQRSLSQSISGMISDHTPKVSNLFRSVHRESHHHHHRDRNPNVKSKVDNDGPRNESPAGKAGLRKDAIPSHRRRHHHCHSALPNPYRYRHHEHVSSCHGSADDDSDSDVASMSSLSGKTSYSGTISLSNYGAGTPYEVLVPASTPLGLIVQSSPIPVSIPASASAPGHFSWSYGPQVLKVKTTSPLHSLVQEGDYVLSVDGVDVRGMTARELSCWLHRGGDGGGGDGGAERTLIFMSRNHGTDGNCGNADADGRVFYDDVVDDGSNVV